MIKLANLLIVSLALTSLMGCNLKNRNSGNPDVKIETTTSCSSINDEIKCNLSKEGPNKKCMYTTKCEVATTQTPQGCEPLDKDNCEKQVHCAYANNKCGEVSASCGNVKKENACNAFSGLCVWDITSTTCKTDKSGGSTLTTVYEWQKSTLPNINNVVINPKKIVVSDDNQHIYILGNNNEGLWHSHDDGLTWQRFAMINNNPDSSLKGKMIPNATNVELVIGNDNIKDIKPSQHGCVILAESNNQDNNMIFIIEGHNVTWAIDTFINNSNARDDNQSLLTKDKGITFMNVVPINGRDTVIFTQEDDGNKLWFKPIGLDNYAQSRPGLPAPMIVRNADNNAPLHDKPWNQVGPGANGSLIVASWDGDGDNNHTGLWEISANKLPQNNGNLVDNMNLSVASDDRVLFPVPARVNKWQTSEEIINTVGSFANGNNIIYYAGTNNYLATHVGAQGVTGANAVLTDDFESNITGVKTFLGKLLMVTGNFGLYGIDPTNGLTSRNDNLIFSPYTSSQKEMMANGDPLPFTYEDSRAVLNVFGDDDKSFWHVSTDGAANAGLYVRSKKQGSPRP